MDIIELFHTFRTQEQAVNYLEKVRWAGEPVCPYCGSTSIGRHASGDRNMARWQCRNCTRAFAVTVGTLFHGTHIPLRDWFLVLALMLTAKESGSAYQIARDLDMRRPTVWSMMQRVRTAMSADSEQEKLLRAIVEADEKYIGGNPPKGGLKDGNGPVDKPKRGRGSKKLPMVGADKSGRKAEARVATPGDLSVKGITCIARVQNAAGQTPVTKEFMRYVRVSVAIFRSMIEHAERCADAFNGFARLFVGAAA